MNQYYNEYLESLTPAKRLLAREAVSAYLKGLESEITCIRTAEDVWAITRDLENEPEEHGVVILCNRGGRVIKKVEISHGGMVGCIIDTRVILREALLCNSTMVFLVHNHPSGRFYPSKEDDEVTLRTKKACEAVGLTFMDHVIVSSEGYYSYREGGKI